MMRNVVDYLLQGQAGSFGTGYPFVENPSISTLSWTVSFLVNTSGTPSLLPVPTLHCPKSVDKGKSVTLVRQQDWRWADQKRFFRNRYNPDKIKVTVIRDYNKSFELFLKGDIDMFGLAKTEFWYNKLPNDHPLVTNGYYPRLPSSTKRHRLPMLSESTRRRPLWMI